MIFERMLLMALAAAAFFLIILPLYKFLQPILAKANKDPVKEAKVRLEVAKADFEAAKLNKEAEAYYEKIYDEALQDAESEELKSFNKKA